VYYITICIACTCSYKGKVTTLAGKTSRQLEREGTLARARARYHQHRVVSSFVSKGSKGLIGVVDTPCRMTKFKNLVTVIKKEIIKQDLSVVEISFLSLLFSYLFPPLFFAGVTGANLDNWTCTVLTFFCTRDLLSYQLRGSGWLNHFCSGGFLDITCRWRNGRETSLSLLFSAQLAPILAKRI